MGCAAHADIRPLHTSVHSRIERAGYKRITQVEFMIRSLMMRVLDMQLS